MNRYIIIHDDRGNLELAHALKGSEWANHKYIKKIEDRYFYTIEELRAYLQGVRDEVKKTGSDIKTAAKTVLAKTPPSKPQETQTKTVQQTRAQESKSSQQVNTAKTATSVQQKSSSEKKYGNRPTSRKRKVTGHEKWDATNGYTDVQMPEKEKEQVEDLNYIRKQAKELDAFRVDMLENSEFEKNRTKEALDYTTEQHQKAVDDLKNDLKNLNLDINKLNKVIKTRSDVKKTQKDYDRVSAEYEEMLSYYNNGVRWLDMFLEYYRDQYMSKG